MQRYLIATATGMLVLTLGGCAVTPLDDGSYRHQRHDGWDKDRNYSQNADRDRRQDDPRWNRDRDDDRHDWHDDDRYDRR